jgi:type II secretory pathway predicted ATPase ExeA
VTYSSGPYNPGFGIDPPVLAGRDDEINHILAALHAGPRDHGFTSALTGDRGVGKTVVLNKVQSEVQEELHWPVIALQAVPEGEILLPLTEALRDAASSTWQRVGSLVKALDKEITVSANLLVVQASATAKSGASPPRANVAALERIFTAVGEAAQKRSSGVLITIDEAHVIPRTPDLAVLGAAIQLVTKRKKLPVAVVFAGLPELRQRFRGIGTFLERLNVIEIGNLTNESVAYALVKPAADELVRYDDDALDLIVDASGGYPYLVQLLGQLTWKAAAGRRQIKLSDAIAGVAAAKKEMDGIHQARWDGLTDLERDYVYIVAINGPGPVEGSTVQRALGRTSGQLSSTRAGLIGTHRILLQSDFASVKLTWEGFRKWVAAHEREVSTGPRARRP